MIITELGLIITLECYGSHNPNNPNDPNNLQHLNLINHHYNLITLIGFRCI
jgi:hypothetical protein